MFILYNASAKMVNNGKQYDYNFEYSMAIFYLKVLEYNLNFYF